jgi:pyruvate dehydrogenase E2 component (dihydrolipoamide acetyltransferase)
MVPQISSSADRIKASPLARKVAQQRNIDLATIQGSGPNGRIVRDDVERAGSAAPVTHVEPTRPQLHAVAAPAIPRATSEAGGQRRPFSKMRETIARRMQESVVQAPHFYTTTSISMIQALRLRGVLKERAEFKGISVNHLVVKAAGYALAKEPRVNYAVKDNEVYIPNQINIGIITAIEDGLLIPVVREVDTLALKDLVFEARAAVERAKAGRPSSTDLTGGTFSISNMGMFDVDSFTAIINPGQGAILAVGSVREEPVVQNGQIVIDQRMKVTLSVDHRIIDGVMAGTFLRHFKEALEIPALLM